jgi:hypothetical protein
LLVCLRVLIRRCVHGNIGKDEVAKLFPEEVSPELQRLLTLLLQKFQPEWQEDVAKDQVKSGKVLAHWSFHFAYVISSRDNCPKLMFLWLACS